jgi:hypothetical protein
MAKVRFGAGITEIRGSIGGWTFSKVLGSAIIRKRTKAVAGPPTTQQDFVRNRFASLASLYAGLDGAQVDAWASFASGYTALNSLGEAYTPSPKQMFAMCNINLVTIGQSPQLVPDGTPTVPDVITADVDLTVEVASGTLDSLAIDNLSTSDSSGNTFVLQATPPINTTRRNYQTLCRQLKVGDLATMNSNHADAWNDLFGIGVAVGDVIGLRIRAVSKLNGVGSAWYYFSGVAVPA